MELKAGIMSIRFLCVLLLALSTTGCGIGSVIGKAIPQYTGATYSGLAGQPVGVLVWADRGIMMDWNSIGLDLANNVQAQISMTKAPEVKDTTWPYPPASYVKYMRDHPGLESAPVTDIATKFAGITRLIYVEVQNFRTRSQSEIELFRGEATLSVKVVEIDDAGNAIVAFSEDNIKAVYPDYAPPDGVPTLGDNKTYLGTVEEMAMQVARRLMTHETPQGRGS